MYVPGSFAVTDRDQLHSAMEAYSFATVVTTDGSLTASHLPLVLRREEGELGTLYGHFARANSHWKECPKETLTIFSGPHAYISPTWYGEPGTVPTWNYIAVHAHGPMEVIEDKEVTLDLLESMARLYEPSDVGWRFDREESWIQKMIPAIVAFRISIRTLEGKWKLSQNHSIERRRRVTEALASSASESDRQIAEFMRNGLSQG